MDETCEFCGTGNFAHKRLVCGAQVARLEAAIRAKDALLGSLLEDGRLSATTHDNIRAALDVLKGVE